MCFVDLIVTISEFIIFNKTNLEINAKLSSFHSLADSVLPGFVDIFRLCYIPTILNSQRSGLKYRIASFIGINRINKQKIITL